MLAIPILAAATAGATDVLDAELGRLLRPLSSPVAILAGVLVVVLLAWIALRSLATTRRLRTENGELRSRLHGASVRRGHLGEALAPLLDQFPVAVGRPGSTTLFLGQPVDYVHFDERDGITFVEIKTGGAGLSARQRLLREHVQAGNVRWETLSLDTPADDDPRRRP